MQVWLKKTNRAIGHFQRAASTVLSVIRSELLAGRVSVRVYHRSGYKKQETTPGGRKARIFEMSFDQTAAVSPVEVRKTFKCLA